MKRIGVVGAGGVARVRAKALLATGEVEICGVASRHMETASRFGDEVGCKSCFDDYRRLTEVDPEALLIEVPHGVQDEISIWALEHGYHLLIGAALAASVAGAERIVELAEQNRLFVEAGFEARYRASWNLAKEMLTAGELGQPIFARSLALWDGDPNTWYYRQADSAGMPLTHMTYCFINPIRYILGDPVRVSAVANRKKHVASDLVEQENCAANLSFPDGTFATLTAGFVKPERMSAWSTLFLCTEGAVEVQPADMSGTGSVVIYRGDSRSEETFPAQPTPFEVQAKAFVEALNGNATCRNLAAGALLDIKIAAAIVESAETRQTVAIT